MFAHIRANAATVAAEARKLCRMKPVCLAATAAASLLLAACAQPPAPPLAGPDPSDPGAAVPRVGNRSTLGPYTSQRPVSPAPGREQNESTTPAPKSGP
jgi:hypothetical protein